ncbi:hypothetical protein GUJ93_ZPchr0014g46952 [Zizania palustris]|uniref:Uncharacterized protein n=1 Tax=Zizania palustris TaxID=103762 RepID=A0A8J5THA2_ZIZPA|nr:hypothetical protein GUJ93_ZPchr0014g46952 [Zizania palustris]
MTCDCESASARRAASRSRPRDGSFHGNFPMSPLHQIESSAACPNNRDALVGTRAHRPVIPIKTGRKSTKKHNSAVDPRELDGPCAPGAKRNGVTRYPPHFLPSRPLRSR